MIQQQVYVLTNIIMLIDGAMVICAGYAAYYMNVHLSGQTWTMATDVFSSSLMIVMFANNYILGKIGLYGDRRPGSRLSLAWDILRVNLVNFAVLSFLIFMLKQFDYSRNFFVLFSLFNFLFLFTARLLANEYYQRISHKDIKNRKILIVGSMVRGKFVTELLERQLSWGHEVIGRISVDQADGRHDPKVTLGGIDDLEDILRQHTVDEVIFAIEHDQRINLGEQLKICKKIGVPTRILPSLWEKGNPTLGVEKCQGVPFLVIKNDNFNATGLLYKRLLDIAGSIVGTIIFLLLYPFVAITIKLESPGPAIFKQVRMGQHGRTFKLYKFRTMYKDAEGRKQQLMTTNKMEGAIFKMKDDPRITRVGSFLRKTSIDEIPQFLNVLKGEMSLVGTRPPTLNEVAEYRSWQLRRISIKPGITGLWQTSGRNQITDFNRIVELDCKYFDNWHFTDDLVIIIKTILVVLRRKGAI